MKESRYFPHDIGARNDPKLLRLQMEMKGQGLAIWWCLVEMLWENGGYLPYDPRTLSFTLRWAKPNEIERVLEQVGARAHRGVPVEGGVGEEGRKGLRGTPERD